MLNSVPVPQLDESPSSILMRAASINGWRSARPMLRLVAVHQNGALNGGVPKAWRSPELYAKYMAVLGITLPNEAGAYRQRETVDGIRVFINDKNDLPSLMFRAEGSTFCPLCLIEKPYLRRIWSLKLLDICSIHRCDLVRECPKCSWVPNWDRGAPEKCHCLFDFRDYSATFDNQSDPSEVLQAIEKKSQRKLNALSEKVLQREIIEHRRYAHLPRAYLRY